MAVSDFQNFFEVVTGHCKYAVNRAGGHLLSSLFSLLSAIPPEDAERARPWRLHMRDGFLRRNHDPPLKCSDSSRRSTSLLPAVWCRQGSVPLWRLHFGTSGGLLGSVCSLLSSLFSLSSWSCDAPIPRGGSGTRLMTNPVS